MPTADGGMRREKTPGVPNFLDWKVAWELFKTILLMLDAVDLSTLLQ